MRVLGIDCGTAITGWGVLERKKGKSLQHLNVIQYGVVRTKAGEPMGERLLKLFGQLQKIIKKFAPDQVAIESLFYFKNQKTVISVGQGRGVAILAGAQSGLEIFDYTPLQVKQAVTGYGRAKKKQVQRMVKAILKLKEIPKPDDAADALAVAICHLSTNSTMR